MICEFVVGETYATVTHASRHAMRIIRQVCRARPNGYQWMPRYRSGSWDGYISLLQGKRIPTGLLRLVHAELLADGIKCLYSYSQVRRVAHDNDIELGDVHLRQYQQDAVDVLLRKQRGIAKMATNAGKTVVFAALIKALGNCDALVVVNSKDLLYQTQARLAQYLMRDVGLVGDSHRDDSDVCVATIQTLNSLYTHNKTPVGSSPYTPFEDNTTLIIDECHHVANNRTFDILMSIPGWYRYGMSGTPLDRGKLNDLKLIACTGPVQVHVTNDELIQAGWSAKPVIYMHSGVSPVSDDLWEASYPRAYDEVIVNNNVRNRMICELAADDVEDGYSVLIIVSRIKHGRELTDQLSNMGTMVRFVSGQSSVADRQDALNILAQGLPQVVVATVIFDEGVDVPSLDTIIMAAGGKSHIRVLQRIGRGLRRKADGSDNVVHVHDFIDDGNKYLARHTNKRIHTYEKEKFQVVYDDGTG